VSEARHKHSQESIEKMRISHLGNKSKSGLHLSEETKQKISLAKQGKSRGPHTLETKEKIRKSSFGKHNHSFETRRKISDAKKGIPNVKLRGKLKSVEHRKKLSQSRIGKYCGNKSPSWKGGISFEPYCSKFTKEFKERVRAFFRDTCVLCGKTKIQCGENLCVHHVNFDKMVCCNDVKPLFVILCRSCHGKTNYKREYYENIFTQMIAEKYDGKCYVTKEVKKSV
jgi:hypothetical protein